MSATRTPPAPLGAAQWARRRLFATRRDSVVTVITGAVVLYVVVRILRFVFVTGRWEIVRVNLSLYLYGRYPKDDLWRVVLTLAVIAMLGGLVAGVVAHRQRVAAEKAGEPPDDRSLPERVRDLVIRLWPMLALVLVLLTLSSTITPWFVAAGVVVAGAAGRIGGAMLPKRATPVVVVACLVAPFVLLPFLTAPLGWDEWGGLMLTLLLASVSMLACFPLGLLLALGRRSSMPAIRAVSVGIIEFFRGVPLVVLVIMSDVALGFFFPQSILPGKVTRVLVAFTIFTAAYVAEIVRGGLQSVPRGQTEAAQALGMSPVRITGWIVLPQALRNTIPALVGQFISLFKDTTLVFIIGFLDVLSVADAVTKQDEFDLSNFTEAAIFAAVLFWVGAYTLSRESQRLERRLGVGTR